MADVSIIDYGIGNILSVKRAFEYVGSNVEFISSPKDIAKAKRVVLPGVGAFNNGIQALFNLGLVQPIIDYCQSNRPFLGICLGMQLMLGSSDEFGLHKGLDLIHGHVKKISSITLAGTDQKTPRIGWYPVSRCNDYTTSIMKDVSDIDRFYFVHSYACHVDNYNFCLATSSYGGHEFSVAIRNGNIYGLQFHPEKSGNPGLNIIRNFSIL